MALYARSLTLALILLAAASTTAQEGPFAGERAVRLNDAVRAEFVGATGELHHLSFYAAAGTRISAAVRVETGDLRLRARLERPGGADAIVRRGAVGALGRRGRRARLDGLEVAVSGTYVLAVERVSGAGTYRLTTRGRRPRRARGVLPLAGTSGVYRFPAEAGTVLQATISAVRSNRRPAPTIIGIDVPDGSEADVGVPVTRGGETRVRRITLPVSGRYALRWANPSAAPKLRIELRFDHPRRPRRNVDLGVATGLPPGVIDRGEPALDPRQNYVGSATCGQCHPDLYVSWSRTAHHLSLRDGRQGGVSGLPFVNDANGNGRDDFRDGRDLAQDAAFAALGANAPRLSFVAGDVHPHKMTIGTATFDVVRTLGGNGLWEQRFLVRGGRSLHFLPITYDEPLGEYLAVDLDDWYDDTGQPRHLSAASLDPTRSFEALCSGCHVTGEQLLFLPSAGEVLAGYVETGIGCEQCHGPGAAHAATGDVELIANPRHLVDGTAAGVEAAVDVCGRCHTRGTSIDPIAGTDIRPGFGYSLASGVAHFGDDIDALLTPASDDATLWGRKGDDYVAPRLHPLQARDLQSGAHASRSGAAPACFDCHDPHGSGQPHLIVKSVDRGTRVATQKADNSLCLSCHAGLPGGPFVDVDPSHAAAIAGAFAPVPVVRATIDHMKDVGMPVADALYNPSGTGVGRCDLCHMPETASAAGFGTDAAGHAVGVVPSHRFENIWPNASELHGMTNSCSVCHPTRPDDRVARIIDEWAVDSADADGTFHASTPRSFQNGTANAERNGGLRCAQCHTTEGFVRIQVRGETLGQPEIDEIVSDAVGHDVGITCRVCHGAQPDGTFADGENPLRFPADELCGRCHNGETVQYADFRDHGERIRHPQQEMIDGTAGVEIPGTGVFASSEHSFDALFPKGCVNCHYDTSNGTVNGTGQGAANHDFQPQVASCSECHSGLTSFDRTARGDFDGDGSVEGLQSEVDGLLAVLTTALLADPDVTFDGRAFQFGGATDGKLTGASEPQKRAVFNVDAVVGDASRGIHNPLLTVQLLQRSYLGLTGNPVPSAVLR